MNNPDADLFRALVGDVTPLDDEDERVALRPSPRPEPGLLMRRQAATRSPRHDPNPLTVPDQVPEVGPLDIVGERKDGVQEGVYRKLRLGKYEIQARLDLHRITLKDARVMVYEFLQQSHAQSLRTVLITHGKGQHSPTPGRLKSYVMHWMQESDLVLAWHSARSPHGGTGATYVLLRKAAEERLRNRAFYQEQPSRQRRQ